MIEIKQLPESFDAEVSVLACLFNQLSEDSEEILGSLTSEHFWRRCHQIIFTVISDMIRNGEKVDMITVTSKLKDQGKLEEVGGAHNVSSIALASLAGSQSLAYLEILKDKLTLRKAVELGYELQQRANNCEDLKVLIPEIEAKLFSLSSVSNVKVGGIEEALERLDSMVEKRRAGIGDSGILSGIPSFDKVTGGLLPGRYYVIAGRPKSGKTAIACQIALNFAMKDQSCLFISIEMSSDRLLGRMASNLSQIPYHSFLNCTANENWLNQFRMAYHVISKKPFYIETPVEPTGAEIRSMIRRYKRKHDIKLVVIDYLQKTKVLKGDARSSVAEASEAIRCACKESGVPAIVLCQLNREADKERPRMSHLKESGAIEQDADCISLLWREKENDDLTPGELVPIVLAFDANRDGPICDQKLLYDGKIFKFKERAQESKSLFYNQ